MTGEPVRVRPLPGPLDVDPTAQVYALVGTSPPGRFPALALARAMLDEALAGVERGEYDSRIIDWLKDWDVPTVATLASLMHRCRQVSGEAKAGGRAHASAAGHRTALPLLGPLDAEPDVRSAAAELQLDAALAGLPMGAHDAAVHLWVLEKDAPTVATLASWLRRSWAAGVEAGRAEKVDEAPTVAALRAQVADLTSQLDQARYELRSAQRERADSDGALEDALGDLADVEDPDGAQ